MHYQHIISRLGRSGQKRAHLDDELDGLLKGDVIGVVLLQQVLRRLLVGPDRGGLPTAVVAARIALIELEASVPIPAIR